MFQPSQIKYIKSVTRDGGNSLAYMEQEAGDIFPLHFPNNIRWYPTNYEKVTNNDIIVLFQKLNIGRKHTYYFTHLVIPVELRAYKVENNATHPYARMMAVLAKNNNLTPTGSEYNFKHTARGQICDISNLKYYDKNATQLEVQESIWNSFNMEILHNLINIDFVYNSLSNYNIEVIEGAEGVREKLHRYKERNRLIIKLAKQKAKQESKLFCCVCKFDFEKEYPGHGEGFIECHHIEPIAKGGIRSTRVEDLAMVCPNCHRMLHRKRSDNTYPTIDDLQKIIAKR